MPAYVVSMMTIHDPDTYKKYTDLTPPIVSRYGGRFLTRGEKVTTVEGEAYTARMVILEFPSQKHIEDWFADPEYQAAIKFRHASSKASGIARDQISIINYLKRIKCVAPQAGSPLRYDKLREIRSLFRFKLNVLQNNY